MKSDTCQPILDIRFRSQVLQSDVAAVRDIVEATGFFTPDEARMAASLVRERLAQGPESGYLFLFAESGRPGSAHKVLGYACYGPIDCADGRYDLYWIAVRPERQGLGLGRELLASVEERVRTRGGTRMYAETSSQQAYEPTRGFYEKNGYVAETRLKDFYRPGDDKIFYVKDLAR